MCRLQSKEVVKKHAIRTQPLKKEENKYLVFVVDLLRGNNECSSVCVVKPDTHYDDVNFWAGSLSKYLEGLMDWFAQPDPKSPYTFYDYDNFTPDLIDGWRHKLFIRCGALDGFCIHGGRVLKEK